ncbi:MAG: hypothetical protein PHO02_06020 [Candidatus Nanoarchaeia archaeon]|nr:hypothetical protein [Candidatus Nanoarchaeia archaeon]
MPLWVHPEQAEENVEFLENVECWNELEKIIKMQSGQDNIKKYELLFYYGAMYGAAAMPAERKSKIPGTLVEKEGIDYCIHGLMHIEERIPYVHENFSEIKEVVCETNLKRLFKLPNLIDQSRFDECKYVPLIDTARSFGMLYGKSFLYWAWAKFQGKEYREDMKCLQAQSAAENERLIMIIGDTPVYISDIRLPERLEHGYIESSIDDDYFERFCALRSLAHTDFIEKFAKSRGLKEAHGIYGLLHEPEIAYFLRYPEKAGEYKDKFKKCCFF